jgi:solute carrier family 35 (GDP-fucose transporter), member C1
MLITIGFFLGVRQEKTISNLNEYGVVYGVLSAFFSALTGVYIKKTIKLLNDDLWKLNFYNNLYASLAILPIIFYQREQERIIQFEGLTSCYFWFILSLTGFLGFLVGYATSLQIQLTSPLTHNISGTTKSCLQTVLGVVYFLETKTFLWWLSNVFILIGAFLYSVVRNQEMNLKKKQVNLSENEI